MARKTVTYVSCDICEAEGASTVTFIAGGKTRDIDLCKTHAAELEKAKEAFEQAVAPYIAKSAVVVTKGKVTKVTKVKSDTSAIRAWAAANNIELPKRGRIPAKIYDQYQAETDGI